MPEVIGCGVNSVNSSHLWTGRQEKTGKDRPGQIGPVKTRYDTAKNKLKPNCPATLTRRLFSYEIKKTATHWKTHLQISASAQRQSGGTRSHAEYLSPTDNAGCGRKLGNRPH